MMSKIKDFFLEKNPDERKPSRPRTAAVRRPRGQSTQESQAEKIDYQTYLVLGLLFVFAAAILLSGNSRAKPPLDPVTLCPADENHIPSRTYVLMDLSERLRPGQRHSLRRLIKASSNNLEAREQINISRLQSNQKRPRKELLSFCSPDIGYIEKSVGERISPEDDCRRIVSGEFRWPPGIGQNTRRRIRTTCESYSELQKRAEQATKTVPDANPEESRSYIVRALEDIMHEANAARNGGRLRLIVFSDMLQNAEWFSQYIESHESWTTETLRDRRRNASGLGTEPENNFDEILLCYLRNDFIGTAEQRVAHKKMWARYFSAPKRKFRDTTSNGCGSMAEFMMGEAEEA